MKQLLFQEFEPVSAKQWKNKIQADLKGADYNEKLVTKTLHGIDIKPFYSSEDVGESLSITNPANWNICEKIYITSEASAVKKAKEKLAKGTEALWFIIPTSGIDMMKIISSLPVENPVYLQYEFLDAPAVTKLSEDLKNSGRNVFLRNDILGNLARTGNWFQDLDNDHSQLDQIIHDRAGFSSVLSVDLSLYQNSGANIPQQIAYAMAHAVEYLQHLDKLDAKDKSSLKLQFYIAVGSDYFFEIAKIRALRWVFATLAREFGFPEDCHIIAEPTKRTKTLYDYNVNLLRTTTESMSAILGGADSICNMPYDAIYHKSNEFGDRIARNQLLVMRNESYFGKVGNVAEGTYYIETITRQMAERALQTFKDIEKGGGFLKSLKEGILQKKIKESASEEQSKFDSGNLVLIGTNKFENPDDRMKEDLELFPFLKQNPRKTLLQPILEKRLSEAKEQQRLDKENAAQPHQN